MTNYIFKVTPDYLPLKAHEFVRHFSNLLTREKYDLLIMQGDYSKVLGYSCRSLFDLTLEYFSKQKDVVIATTPFHHTSFRDVIEKYVKPENIHIIQLNDNYNGIGKLPEVENCDLIVITHLFGQDMDLDILADFKEKYGCLILEDRVQGGTLDIPFSNDVVDMAFYSMAMDKRPIALGGGFIHIRNKYQSIINDFVSLIEHLPREKISTRFKELLKKIPTFLLYNYRPFIFSFIAILNLLNHFDNSINILNITKKYRKSNPGFSRGKYMFRPSRGLLKSMYENLDNHKIPELLYTRKYEFFMKQFPPEVIAAFFPWYKGNQSFTPYNTIILDEKLRNTFLEFLNDYNISSLPNPTYKLFNISYENDTQYQKLNDGIAYLPCIVNMTKEELIALAERIKEFYEKYVNNK